MMLEETLARLRQLKLHGIADAVVEQTQSTMYSELSFEERLGMLIDREVTARDNRRLTNLLRGPGSATQVPAPKRSTSGHPEDWQRMPSSP